jgi:sugar phosphate isomerase/epimerase
MDKQIWIGNQTALAAADRMAPFQFALDNGFDAFEWFEDKKVGPGTKTAGWDEADLDAATRRWIAETGKARVIRFTVHAPWQADPLRPGGTERLLRSLTLAGDIGADLVNLHLSTEGDARSFVRALEPVIAQATRQALRLSIENTPQTPPAHFNETFAYLAESAPGARGTVGMCLDIGHANLCDQTRNDYIRYLDLLAPEVLLIHLHVHENYGDADSHFTLFTGPARTNDAGVRALVQRLRFRNYRGALILEQWPQPPQLLVQAANRLRELLK